MKKLDLLVKNSTGRGECLHINSCMLVHTRETVCMETIKKIVTW